MKITPDAIRHLLATDLNGTGVLPVPSLSDKEMKWREVALATIRMVSEDGWRSTDAQRKGGRRRAEKNISVIVHRWGAVLSILEDLPSSLRAKPTSPETLREIHARICEIKFFTSRNCVPSLSTIKKDLIKLKCKSKKLRSAS